VPCYYPLNAENGFLPRVADIPEEAARRAKYMIVSLPANPVGSVGTPELYAELVAFARKYDILIVHDNAYSDIIFDGAEGHSFFNTPGAMDVGVEFFSLSKSFNVTGARISFLVGRRDVVAAFRKLRSQIDFGMFLPVQYAAIAALTGPLDFVKAQNRAYQDRRDALCGGLRDIGWPVPDSHGSMFVWAPIPAGYASSMDFCLDLVEQSGVLCTPGASFGPLGEGYVRFALTLPPARIRLAVAAIAESGILSQNRT
jgi:LL-diaminopimelate aminotransferase